MSKKKITSWLLIICFLYLWSWRVKKFERYLSIVILSKTSTSDNLENWSLQHNLFNSFLISIQKLHEDDWTHRISTVSYTRRIPIFWTTLHRYENHISSIWIAILKELIRTQWYRASGSIDLLMRFAIKSFKRQWNHGSSIYDVWDSSLISKTLADLDTHNSRTTLNFNAIKI